MALKSEQLKPGVVLQVPAFKGTEAEKVTLLKYYPPKNGEGSGGWSYVESQDTYPNTRWDEHYLLAEAEIWPGAQTYDPTQPRSDIFPIPEYDQIVKETMRKIIELGIKKGGEYAGDEDRLANFRRNAKAADTTMEFVWRIYVAKHWDAIMQYEQDLRTGITRPRMESIEGRIDDIIVYLLLFKAMVRERNRGSTDKFRP